MFLNVNNIIMVVVQNLFFVCRFDDCNLRTAYEIGTVLQHRHGTVKEGTRNGDLYP
jgi:hypothetical protein